MAFDPHIAATRFGTGLSPRLPPPESVDAMLAALKAPDQVAQDVPVDGFDAHLAFSVERVDRMRALREARRNGDAAATEGIRAIGRERAQVLDRTLRATLRRGVIAPDGFRERLTAFWADHFTTRSSFGSIQSGVGAFVEDAIRPHVTGRFADLLIQAVTHPVMLVYLDQTRSMGPNSRAATRGHGGLNENLAREIIELHTLGASGPYDQRDVRALAELLTGLTFSLRRGRHFAPGMAEPGPETVLGRSYGGDTPDLADITAVLEDLARHPATADHLARKLAVHFIADAPPPDLVAALRRAYLATGGDLLAVYAALLAHPAAWDAAKANVKPPLLYVMSALRALDIPDAALADLPPGRVRRLFRLPLRNMGHSWQAPAGPDGLAEADRDWISAPNLAARVQWALAVPERLGPLPDPRLFVDRALGAAAPHPVRFAAGAAETRAEGVGLVLMSPAFQRM